MPCSAVEFDVDANADAERSAASSDIAHVPIIVEGGWMNDARVIMDLLDLWETMNDIECYIVLLNLILVK